ncbi:MAG TPA: ABC transporter permease [Kofleriaceae bacterium]|nr:ABC transporter permease [Kofleriaceae bacterium]
MSALDRKLGRDLWRLKGQVATIALVLACGFMAMIMLRSTWQSLIGARDAYYDAYRFGDVFARLERAPDAAAARLERLPGVAVVYPRIAEDVMVPIADASDPVTGRILSIPDDGTPPLDGLYLRAGRLPVAGAADEAVILEQFAEAHHLQPGDHVPAVIEGRVRQLQVVGIALSPEFVLAMSGREMVADNGRFVVFWMLRSTIAPAFRMEGAFDDVVIQLEPGASLAAVLDGVDRELARYGARHAVGRDKQLSNYALTSELGILRTLALVIPSIFLAVAAFLVNVVLSRLIFLERTQIAVLKALGFSNGRIARHYLVLVIAIVGIASLLGLALGVWSGRWMTALYSDFYRFPMRLHHVTPGLVAITIGIGVVAAVSGAMISLRRIARMPPAEAMRPATPLVYRRSLFEGLGLGASAMMVVREIERRPVRFAMSTLGIAMGVGIFVMGRFSWNSFDYLMDEVFPREHQEDVTVTFVRASPPRALHELAHLPGVTFVEGERIVPVRMHAGARWRDTTITGLPEPSRLRHLMSGGERPIALPTDGLVVNDRLARLLGVDVGDEVEVDLLEGDWRTHRARVAGLIDEAFGLQVYARADWLARLLDEEPRASIALLSVDADRRDEVSARLKDFPSVLGVSTRAHIVERYRAQTGESMLVITMILTLSAAAISIGVVYNNARIALSMRSRDLASLRVLGFTRREISSVLLGELALQVVLGIPLGLWLGHAWAALMAQGFDPDTVKFPLHIADTTYVGATMIALVSGLVSALLVRRKLDHLDLVAVLKSASE